MAPGRKPLVFDRPLRGRIYDSIAETIGNTPLVRIPHIVAEEGITADICLKLEFFNPIASVKDRIGVNMIMRSGSVRQTDTWRNDRRTDLRQYRDRPGLRCRRARLSADPYDARIDIDRAAQDACLSRARNWN